MRSVRIEVEETCDSRFRLISAYEDDLLLYHYTDQQSLAFVRLTNIQLGHLEDLIALVHQAMNDPLRQIDLELIRSK